MRLRSLLAILILVSALPSRATEYTDLWWNPAESGWGLTITHQGSVLFLTIFVFGQDSKSVWFASPTSFQETDPRGFAVYSGPLYQSTGSAFSAPYSASAAHANAVGAVRLVITGAASAELSYTVNGVGVGKSIVRQTFRNNEDVPGNYIGGLVTDSFTCPFPIVGNGNGFQKSAAVNIVGPATNLEISIGDGRGCTSTGNYTQDGRLGHVEGNLVCPNLLVGMATFSEVEANRTGISSSYVFNYVSGCVERGRYTGARLVGSP